MKYFPIAFIAFLFFCPSVTRAYVPLVVVPNDDEDILTIESPETSQTFYGELKDFPHMYRISAEDEFMLSLTVGVPGRGDAKNIVHGIVLRQLHRGGVEEITRLDPKTASWEEVFEPFSVTSYRKGVSFSEKLPPGEYLIEMSTPDNREPYMFTIGTEKGSIGYFEMLGRLSSVKHFYGQSPLGLVLSPLVYVPLTITLVLGVVSFILWRRLKMKQR